MDGHQKRSARTRARIIAAAADCFRDAGVQGSSIEAIAARAMVTKPTVYAHFATKDDLLSAVIGAAAHDLRDAEWPAFDSARSVADQLVENFERYLDHALKPRNVKLYRVLLFELSTRGDPSQAIPSGTGATRLRDWLQQAQRHGALPAFDTQAASTMWWALVKGLHFYPAVTAGKITPPKDRKQALAEVVQTCLRSVGAETAGKAVSRTRSRGRKVPSA